MGSASAHEPDLEPGTVVGDYRIDSTIGIGGMAAVYQATQPIIGKRVAIKVLHRTKTESALNRFIKEARAVNLIGHPNIVDVFGFGMTDSGRPYLVMELLVGETLAVRIKREPISVAETCDTLIEVTHALEAAHEAGVIHRDLKPENIFLEKRRHVRSVKLLDFGIAKLIDEQPGARGDDTRPGILIGTPKYISPEQVRGTTLDGRADIYTLGVVAFELFAGRAPFLGTPAGGAYELFEKHAKLKAPKPSAFNIQLPEVADALLHAMLAKEPNERPSLVEVRETLQRLRNAPASALAAERAAVAAQPTDVHAAPPQSAMETPTTRTERAAPPTEPDRPSTSAMETPTRQVARVEVATRRRWPVALAAGGAVMAAIVAIAIASTGSKLPPARADDVVPSEPAGQAQQLSITPIAPSVAATPVTATAASADAGLGKADDTSIELDPVRGSAHAAAAVHAARHVKPASPAKPTPPSDDDGVRSPFAP
ncbi:MAG TPA: serine/threonine-protein kinase [Kofleriaceae bacterium]|jgi:serine/threonine-protein kinase|nr:serine/threonine-protein kinase [Kofleriaceae bacterium]